MLSYQVDWVGFDKDVTWYPASDLMYAPHLLRDYHREHPNDPGPPLRLPEWIKAYESGIDNYDDLFGDKAMTERSRRAFLQGGG